MYLLYIRGLHGGADTTIRKTEAFGTDGAILASDKEKPLYRGPRKAAKCGVPAERIFGGVTTSTLCGKRSNRAQANGKPLFQAAFLQFSANCDAGAY